MRLFYECFPWLWIVSASSNANVVFSIFVPSSCNFPFTRLLTSVRCQTNCIVSSAKKRKKTDRRERKVWTSRHPCGGVSTIHNGEHKSLLSFLAVSYFQVIQRVSFTDKINENGCGRGGGENVQALRPVRENLHRCIW